MRSKVTHDNQPTAILSIAFILASWLSVPLLRAQSSLQTGPYYALIIGNNNYKYAPKLVTPINDAKDLARLLRERYGFQTKVLLDADRIQILTALAEYRRTLPENSNLLIYYAGHGHHDHDTDEAYWLPVDAQPDNNANWISADDITSDVRAILSQHVLIISDSCYSGYIVVSRGGNFGINPDERHAFLAKMLASKSRNLMSSGGDEPVDDAGAPGHSVFAAALLSGLRKMENNTFTADDLFYKYVQQQVGGASDQLPQYNWIRNSGHKEGDFVFSVQPATSMKEPIVGAAAVTGPSIGARSTTETASLRTIDHEADRNTGSGAFAAKKPPQLSPTMGWVVGYDGTMLYTKDGGRSWKPKSGFSSLIYSLIFVTPQSGWIASEDGILHTEDGGQSWKLSKQTPVDSLTFVTPQVGWAVGEHGTILHTDDGGSNWKPQKSGTTEILWTVAFVTSQLGWAVGEDGSILHTDDGGDNWKLQNSGTIQDLDSVAFVTPQEGWVVGHAGTILHTDDGGNSWTPQTSGTTSILRSVAFLTPKEGWVVGGDILHTDDGGISWKPQESGVQRLLFSVAFATPQLGWAVGEAGTILLTDDGGNNWKPQKSGTTKHLLSVAFAPLQ